MVASFCMLGNKLNNVVTCCAGSGSINATQQLFLWGCCFAVPSVFYTHLVFAWPCRASARVDRARAWSPRRCAQCMARSCSARCPSCCASTGTRPACSCADPCLTFREGPAGAVSAIRSAAPMGMHVPCAYPATYPRMAQRTYFVLQTWACTDCPQGDALRADRHGSKWHSINAECQRACQRHV